MTEEEIQKDIEENSCYCPICDSCGETGCCSPVVCKQVQCKYGEEYMLEYEKWLQELDILYIAIERLASCGDKIALNALDEIEQLWK